MNDFFIYNYRLYRKNLAYDMLSISIGPTCNFTNQKGLNKLKRYSTTIMNKMSLNQV